MAGAVFHCVMYGQAEVVKYCFQVVEARGECVVVHWCVTQCGGQDMAETRWGAEIGDGGYIHVVEGDYQTIR